MAGLIIRLGFNYLVNLCLCLRSNNIVIYFCHCKTKISGLGNPYQMYSLPKWFFFHGQKKDPCNLKKPVVYMVFAHTMLCIVALSSDRQILYNVCICIHTYIYYNFKHFQRITRAILKTQFVLLLHPSPYHHRPSDSVTNVRCRVMGKIEIEGTKVSLSRLARQRPQVYSFVKSKRS